MSYLRSGDLEVCRYRGTVDPTPLLIIGSGGHAKVVIDIVDAIGGYEIVGIVSDDDSPSRLVAGHRILSDFSGLPAFLDEGIRHVAIGIGGWTDNEKRPDGMASRAARRRP